MNSEFEALASFSHQQLKDKISKYAILTGIPESDSKDDIPEKVVEVLEKRLQ